MGTTDGAFSNWGSMRMQQLLPLRATLFIAAFAITLSMPSAAEAASSPPVAFRFPAIKVQGRVVTFELSGIAPESIRSAYVRCGAKRRHLRLSQVRAAARSGVLRLHMAGVRVSHRSSHARVSRHQKGRRKKATLVVVTNPSTPTPPNTPTTPITPITPPTTATTTKPKPKPKPNPAPRPASRPVVSWRPVGSRPLSDAAAKALVTPRAETRPANASANHYLPNGFELAAFHAAISENPLERYVSGHFTGTTDEILQWGAHKWGIPEDVLRAVAVDESWWRQGAAGDRRDGVNAALYPAQSRIDVDSVFETLGLMQIKWRPDGSLHPGTEPLRWKSTAFNVDYYGASIRYYYDGLCDWCRPGYGPGQAWESIGGHYDPSPWRNTGALNYIATIKRHLADRTWARTGF